MNVEEAKKYCKQIKDRDLWKIGYVYGGEAISTVLDESEKQQKIINEMAKYIKEPYQLYLFKGRMTKMQAIIEYFTKKVEG